MRNSISYLRTLFMWRAGSDFCRDNRAHAAVEYALMLAMIVGSALLIIDALGRDSSATFGGLSGTLGGQRQVSSSGDPAHGDGSSAAAGQTQSSASVWGLARLAVTCGLLAAALGGVLVVYRARRARNAPETDDVPPAETAPPAEQLRYIAKRQQILRGLANDGRRVLHNQLLVRQIMSTPHARVLPETPCDELCELMSKYQIRHLLVCSGEGELRGIISDRDKQAAAGKTAADIMTPRPMFVGPEHMLAHAVTIMLERRISALPVLDNGRLVGIVTMTDVAMALQCTLQLVDRLIAEIEGVVEGNKSAEDLFPRELGPATSIDSGAAETASCLAG